MKKKSGDINFVVEIEKPNWKMLLTIIEVIVLLPILLLLLLPFFFLQWIEDRLDKQRTAGLK